jgi:hypothetical protein
MGKALSREELEAAQCWEPADRVPGRPEMTAFRQRVRYHQALWRESRDLPIGSQPIVARKGTRSRPVGSRLPLGYARETGANFLTPAALDAARTRTSYIEPHQSLDHQRLWADLLWSATFAFNLFGDLATDVGLADRAVHTWWPDVPGTVASVLFAHSPGWLDPAYAGNLMAFDAAFVLDLGDGSQGILGVETRYHERLKPETPKPARASHYRQLAETSGVFTAAAIKGLNGRGPLLVMWLEHLLELSMLQLPSGTWTWGRLAVIHPAGNVDFAEGCAHYRSLLVDQSTFSSMTLEDLLAAGALPAWINRALRDRYVMAS